MGFGLMATLGLLGLIGVPVLIIIYIIKPKYQERKISSTYIWKLSLKYRKRKIPLQWLKSLLLIVQCIIVAVIAMLLAKPYISNAMNGYNYRKIIVIDASASMMTVGNDGKTRFQRAIDKACEIAETATSENTMSVIMCSDTSVTVVKEDSEVGNIQRILKAQKPKGTDANYGIAVAEALKLAGETSAGFTLITDHNFEDNGYFEVINVSQAETNIAVDDAWEDIDAREYLDEQETIVNKDYLETVFYANYFSYNTQATIIPCANITYSKDEGVTVQTGSVELGKVQLQPYVNGNEEIVEDTYFAQVVFSYQDLRSAVGGRFTDYITAEFYCKDENGNVISDAFADDDRYFVMTDASNEKYQVMLTGNDEENSIWYLDTMMQSVENSFTEKLTLADSKNSGYDLYIYNQYVPTTFPNDGAIWLVNPPAGTYNNLGITVGASKTVAPSGAKINPRSAGHSIMAGITEVSTPFNNMTGVFAYTQYVPVTVNDKTSNISQCVMTADGSEPLILAGEVNRVKFTVFAFDLKFTDFPLVFQNYPIMTQSIIDYSTDHTILNSAGRPAYGDYQIGEEITVNVQPNTTKLTISVGSEENLETKTYEGEVDLSKPIVTKLNRGGVYTITQTTMGIDGVAKDITHQVFVRCNSDESNFALNGGFLTGEEQPEVATSSTSTRKEVIYKYFALALVALLLIEWGLQYREQY